MSKYKRSRVRVIYLNIPSASAKSKKARAKEIRKM